MTSEFKRIAGPLCAMFLVVTFASSAAPGDSSGLSSGPLTSPAQQVPKDQSTAPRVSRSVVMEGELVCLPGADGPDATMACAIGLRDDSGRHYVLEDIQRYLVAGAVAMGDRVRVKGRMRPAVKGRFEARATIQVTSMRNMGGVR